MGKPLYIPRIMEWKENPQRIVSRSSAPVRVGERSNVVIPEVNPLANAKWDIPLDTMTYAALDYQGEDFQKWTPEVKYVKKTAAKFYCHSLKHGNDAYSESGDGSAANPWCNLDYAIRQVICIRDSICCDDFYFLIAVDGVIDYSVMPEYFPPDLNRIVLDFSGGVLLDLGKKLEINAENAWIINLRMKISAPLFNVYGANLYNCEIDCKECIGGDYCIDTKLYAIVQGGAKYAYGSSFKSPILNFTTIEKSDIYANNLKDVSIDFGFMSKVYFHNFPTVENFKIDIDPIHGKGQHSGKDLAVNCAKIKFPRLKRKAKLTVDARGVLYGCEFVFDYNTVRFNGVNKDPIFEPSGGGRCIMTSFKGHVLEGWFDFFYANKINLNVTSSSYIREKYICVLLNSNIYMKCNSIETGIYAPVWISYYMDGCSISYTEKSRTEYIVAPDVVNYWGDIFPACVDGRVVKNSTVKIYYINEAEKETNRDTHGHLYAIKAKEVYESTGSAFVDLRYPATSKACVIVEACGVSALKYRNAVSISHPYIDCDGESFSSELFNCIK